MKNILGAGVVLADIIAGMAAPAVIAGFHKETHAHQLGTIGFYAVLALLTMWVVMSVLGSFKGSGTPAPRPGYGSQFGGRGR